MNESLLTAEQVATILNVTKNTVYQWVVRREIPFVKLPGRLTRFSKLELEQWMKARTASGKKLEKGFYLEAA